MEVILLGEIRAILVRIDSELDHHIAGYIREAADGRIRSTNAVNVIFDFSNVSFMDSSGIGMIMGRYKAVKVLGGKTGYTDEARQCLATYAVASDGSHDYIFVSANAADRNTPVKDAEYAYSTYIE